MTIHKILKEYWGFDAFRPLQEDIVNSILSGKDTLALLPTGGGKSICFQVPAMAMEGLCLVISPLIALMKDQVENLEERGIKAHAIYAGLHRQEIQTILSNCVHGVVKFLYISPERLGSSLIRDHLHQINISLLAIDEAHCISQWGFDFRPEYRKIIETREYLPKVPVIALTATATAKVVEDIQTQLGFKQANVFRKSFERLNLHYVVRKQENKLEKVLSSIQKARGSGLVYVRNRKLCEEIASFLIANNISASFYHAGLQSELRQKRQEDWIQNRTRIMVCTNAFGMGIDKPDCSVVVHYEMPDCLEAYYQEAGRAGRNGKAAFCLLVYHSSDAEKMRNRLEQSFPEEAILKRVYSELCSHFQLPIGALNEEGFDFDIGVFSSQIKMNPLVVMNAIKLLSQLDILHVNDAFHQSSRLKMLMNSNELFAFQNIHTPYQDLVKIVLRNYGGIFDNYVPISEKDLAMKINCSELLLREQLVKLTSLGVIDYMPQKDIPQVFIHGHRVDANYLKLNPNLIKARKAMEKEKLEAMIHYAENDVQCRSRVLLDYFDEHHVMDCGACDVCKEKNNSIWPEEKMKLLIGNLNQLERNIDWQIKDLCRALPQFKEEELVRAFRILLDKGILHLNEQQCISWIKSHS